MEKSKLGPYYANAQLLLATMLTRKYHLTQIEPRKAQ
jgi:hypothetical protein